MDGADDIISTTNAVGKSSRLVRPKIGNRVLGPHSVSVMFFAIVLVVFAALAVLLYSSNRHNNQRLLDLQTKEVGSVLSAVLPVVQTPLASAAELAQATHGSARQFKTFATQYVGNGKTFDTMSLWKLQGSHPVEISTVGSTPASIAVDTLTSMFIRATHTSTLVPYAIGGNEYPQLGYAFVAPDKRHDFAVDAESALPQDRLAPTQRNSAFSDLNYALYLGPTARPESFLEASTVHLPLSGPTSTAVVGFGDSKLTIVADATNELGGALSADSWWLVALLGIVLAVIAVIVSERLVRRRQSVEHFAEQIEQLYAQQRDVAVTLQQALLPESLPEIPGIEVQSRYIPGVEGLEIGGDWYDAMPLSETRLLLVIGDVSGRGLNAATIMASLQHTIRAYALQGDAPAVIFTKLAKLVDIRRDHHFATVLCALVDTLSNEVTIVSAGHPPPLLRNKNGSNFIEVPVGPPIGVPGIHEYSSVDVTVDAGATLIGYTDGLTERRGEHLDVGLARLRDIVAESPSDRTLDELLDEVIEGLAPEGPSDDIALIGAEMDAVNDEETPKILVVQSVDESGCPVVRLAGELDLSNVDDVRPTLEKIIAIQPERLVLEISDLTFMDSSGIALFVEVAQLVGTLELDHPSRLIRRVLDATGVSEILKLQP